MECLETAERRDSHKKEAGIGEGKAREKDAEHRWRIELKRVSASGSIKSTGNR